MVLMVGARALEDYIAFLALCSAFLTPTDVARARRLHPAHAYQGGRRSRKRRCCFALACGAWRSCCIRRPRYGSGKNAFQWPLRVRQQAPSHQTGMVSVIVCRQGDRWAFGAMVHVAGGKRLCLRIPLRCSLTGLNSCFLITLCLG